MPDDLSILSDKEIREYREDMIDYKPTARGLGRIIAQVDTLFTIGVVGSWGVGKTSLVRMTEDVLKRGVPGKKKKDCALKGQPTVWFKAWAYDKTGDLRVALTTRTLEEMVKDGSLWKKIKARAGKVGWRIDWAQFANWLLSLVPLSGEPLKVVKEEQGGNEILAGFRKGMGQEGFRLSPGRP